MPFNKTDPIYDYEIRDQAELNTNLWKVSYSMWERAVAQNAPPALIEKLLELTECFHDADELMKILRPCFPHEPQGQA